MAKYLEPFEDTQDLFTKKITQAGLSNFLTITIIVNNTAKDIFKVSKTNDLFKHRSGDINFVYTEFGEIKWLESQHNKHIHNGNRSAMQFVLNQLNDKISEMVMNKMKKTAI
jgi:hypothetical protein